MAKKKYQTKRGFAKSSKWIILIGLILIGAGLFLKNGLNQNIQSKPTNESTQSAKPKASPQSKPTNQPANSFSPQSPNGVPILTYHYIANNPNPKDTARNALEVPPDKFEEQMQYLSSNGYVPISLDTLFAVFSGQAVRPSKAVVLTFDDGYIDFYTTAFPILRRFNFHAVSFIPTGLIGTGYYMNWGQIKEIQSSGLVTFEAHTVTHANLTGLSSMDAIKQLVDSKNVLNSQTGYPVNFVAYPYGLTNTVVQDLARSAGFVGGLGTWVGKASGIGMNMPRIKVSGFWSIKEFAARL